MAQAPDSLGFRFAVVLALAVIIVTITTWASYYERASAGSTSQDPNRIPAMETTRV
jgi:hypothetical protein